MVSIRPFRRNDLVRALICGANGQDGSYLAQFLISKNYEVWGTSRDVEASSLANLRLLGIEQKVRMISMAPSDFRSVLNAVTKSNPDEIYYLSGQSSVGLSFEQPAETLESIVTGVLNLLEIIRWQNKNLKFYNAGSSECFGDTGTKPANENTAFNPRSPYAVAKASAHWLVANYRESYNLHASTGILFNHESPLRQKRFVTQKIIQSAKRISEGSKERLTLGRLDIIRDWGWAPDYVEAMWKMLQQQNSEDFIIATGISHSLEEFVNTVFSQLNLEWKEYVDIDEQLYRPTDISISVGDPSKASRKLGWNARHCMEDVVRMMFSD